VQKRQDNPQHLTLSLTTERFRRENKETDMKKVLRLIVVALTLVSFTAAFADVKGTTGKNGGRSQSINSPVDITLGQDLTLLFLWQMF
jgi:hypothetical protein